MRFWKITAAGNDFILIYNVKKKSEYFKKLSIKLCERRYGIGADGLLVVNKQDGEFYLKYFNSDGSTAFCGNGMRASGLWLHKYIIKKNKFFINTSAGKLLIKTNNNKIFTQMPKPEFLRPFFVKKSKYNSMSYLKVGTNHLVIEANNIDSINVLREGGILRYHQSFMPEGTNVNFVEFLGFKRGIIKAKIRTYEKGVEDETYSCSSGISSSFYVLKEKYNQNCAVFFTKKGERFDLFFNGNNLFLSGPVSIVFKGEL